MADAEVQRALFASFARAPPAAAAPASSYARSTFLDHEAKSGRALAERQTYGRRNDLVREGALVSRDGGRWGGSSAEKSPRAPAAGGGGRRRGSCEECNVRLGSGWFQRTSPMLKGKWEVCGEQTVVEGKSNEHFVCTFTPPASDSQGTECLSTGVFDYAIDAKASKLLGMDTFLRFGLVVGYRSRHQFYLILGDADDGAWSVICYADGQEPACLARVADPSLRHNKVYRMLVQCREDVIAVSAGGRVVFQGVPVRKGTLLGNVGVATRRSKMAFKSHSVSVQRPGRLGRGGARETAAAARQGNAMRTVQAGGEDLVYQSRQPPGSSLAAAAAHSGRQSDTVRDGCMQIPTKYMNGAREAGLGGGDGMYGHMHVARGVRVGETSDAGSSFGGGGGGGAPFEEGAGAPFVGAERRFVDMIERDIIDRQLGVTFDDIAALDTAKRLLNEAVTLPLMVPEFFVGVRQPWKGVLLFGPPGTGKTMLAKAAAGMAGTSFFNTSASTLMNKYRGESEKMVRCLFQMARHHAPAIVFVDEVDALASRRGSDNENEADRRFKAELMTQMDGIPSNNQDGKTVMVLATTNVPWLLDEAIRRRLEKRLYIGLPEESAREAMFRMNLQGVATADDVSVAQLARQTVHFSGADIRLACREAAMEPMRRILEGKTPQQVVAMRDQGTLQSPPIQHCDFECALSRTRPSVGGGEELQRYEAWNQEFGAR